MNIWHNRKWSPMLLNQIDKPFNSNDYLFELKFDGIRAIIFASSKEVKIQSRNQKNLTQLFPELQSIKKIVKKEVIFDGEIIVMKQNKPSFEDIQKRLHLQNKNSIEIKMLKLPVTFIAFDILYETHDLTNLKLIHRKKYLNKYPDTENFIKIKTTDSKGIPLFKNVVKLNLEGIVAKNKNGLYHINKRTDDFIKIKNIKTDEFYIGGYKRLKNNLISLALGEYNDSKLNFVGKLSISPKTHIYSKILNLKKSKNYFINFDEDIIYVKPLLTIEVAYLNRTKNNHLRHPKYIRRI